MELWLRRSVAAALLEECYGAKMIEVPHPQPLSIGDGEGSSQRTAPEVHR